MHLPPRTRPGRSWALVITLAVTMAVAAQPALGQADAASPTTRDADAAESSLLIVHPLVASVTTKEQGPSFTAYRCPEPVSDGVDGSTLLVSTATFGTDGEPGTADDACRKATGATFSVSAPKVASITAAKGKKARKERAGSAVLKPRKPGDVTVQATLPGKDGQADATAEAYLRVLPAVSSTKYKKPKRQSISGLRPYVWPEELTIGPGEFQVLTLWACPLGDRGRLGRNDRPDGKDDDCALNPVKNVRIDSSAPIKVVETVGPYILVYGGDPTDETARFAVVAGDGRRAAQSGERQFVGLSAEGRFTDDVAVPSLFWKDGQWFARWKGGPAVPLNAGTNFTIWLAAERGTKDKSLSLTGRNVVTREDYQLHRAALNELRRTQQRPPLPPLLPWAQADQAPAPTHAIGGFGPPLPNLEDLALDGGQGDDDGDDTLVEPLPPIIGADALPDLLGSPITAGSDPLGGVGLSGDVPPVIRVPVSGFGQAGFESEPYTDLGVVQLPIDLLQDAAGGGGPPVEIELLDGDAHVFPLGDGLLVGALGPDPIQLVLDPGDADVPITVLPRNDVPPSFVEVRFIDPFDVSPEALDDVLPLYGVVDVDGDGDTDFDDMLAGLGLQSAGDEPADADQALAGSDGPRFVPLFDGREITGSPDVALDLFYAVTGMTQPAPVERENPSPTAVALQYLKLDGQSGRADLLETTVESRLAGFLLGAGGNPGGRAGDANGNGELDLDDLLLLKSIAARNAGIAVDNELLVASGLEPLPLIYDAALDLNNNSVLDDDDAEQLKGIVAPPTQPTIGAEPGSDVSGSSGEAADDTEVSE